MKALILNSGMGSRMGEITKEIPKCMTKITENDTILSRQLKLLEEIGISEVIITTGQFDEKIKEYCSSLGLMHQYTFVNNPCYATTNYIYSIYLAKEYLDKDNLLLMHGDLVFEKIILEKILKEENSCMAVSYSIPLPKKDFKALVNKQHIIEKIGIEYFEKSVVAQPLYKLKLEDWRFWLEQISLYCEQGKLDCYAENAFNDISYKCKLVPFDFGQHLCAEIDTKEDLAYIKQKLI